MNEKQELYNEELLQTLKQLNESITELPDRITERISNNKELTGDVHIAKMETKISVKELSEYMDKVEKVLADHLAKTSEQTEEVKQAIKDSKVDTVKVENIGEAKAEVNIPPMPVEQLQAMVDNVAEVQKVLAGIQDKEAIINVNTPDEIKITWDRKDAKNPLPVRLSDGGKFYNALTSVVTGLNSFAFDDEGRLKVNSNLEVGDIEIGAVEIKDGDSDARLDVEDNGDGKNAAYVQDKILQELFGLANPGDARDTQNEQTSALGAGGIFEGAGFTKIDQYGHFQILYASLTPIASAQIIWSNDGTTPLGGVFGVSTLTSREVSGYHVIYYVSDNNALAPYYKLKVTNDTTPQGAFPSFISINWLSKDPYNGAWTFLGDQLTNLSRLLLVRAVGMGTQPDGDVVDARADGLAQDISGNSVQFEADLAGSETIQSDWFDTDGWGTAELGISSEVESATLGGVIEYTDDVEATTVFTADFTTDFLTASAHGLTANKRVRIKSTGTLPSPLAEDTDYYVVNPTTNTFQLSLSSGGSAIDLLDNGTGVHSRTPLVVSVERFTYGSNDAENGSLRRDLNTNFDGARITYTNGVQSAVPFYLAINLRVNVRPASNTLKSSIRSVSSAIMTRGAVFAENDAGEIELITRGANGGLRHSINEHEVETPIRPLNQLNTGQGTILASGQTKLPETPLANRKTIEYSNHSNEVDVFWSSDPDVQANTGKILRAGADVAIEVDDSVDIYFIAEDSGGATSTGDEDGSTSGGTSDTPSNALTSNDSRTIFDDAETLTIGGFSYSQVLADINTLRIGVEGRKSSTPATQTVAHEETQNGATTGAVNIISASLAGGTNQLYLVSISRNAGNNITAVTGGGLTFMPLHQNLTGGGRSLDVWYAFGNPTAGVITASMSSSTNGHISVSRFSGVHPTTPIEDHDTATGTGTAVTGPTVSGTNLGKSILAVSHEAASASAGAGYTERSDQTNGSGGNTDSLATESKPLTSTGGETGTMTLASSTDWLAIGVTLLPAPTPDITYLVEYDVNGGGYTSAGSLTFSVTTDETQYVDISGGHPLTETTINQTTIRLTRTSAGVAQGQVDHVFLEVSEGDADSAARISFAEIADTEYD